MLDLIREWIAAGDQAITGMGPIVATALAMLGASGFTQLAKFPLARLVPAGWADWSIKALAVVSTGIALHWLADLPVMLELVLSVAQPYGYTLAMRVIRRFWPWLEAGRVLGSAQPSEASQEAMRARRA